MPSTTTLANRLRERSTADLQRYLKLLQGSIDRDGRRIEERATHIEALRDCNRLALEALTDLNNEANAVRDELLRRHDIEA